MEIHIGQGDLEIAVGWVFLGSLKANRIFNEIKTIYEVDDTDTNDYNVDLCENGEVIDTFNTNKSNADLIEQIYFEN